MRGEIRSHHMGYSFRLTARVLLYDHPTDRIAHTTAFVIPVVEHWLEREISQWVHQEGSIRRPNRTMSERSYHGHVQVTLDLKST